VPGTNKSLKTLSNERTLQFFTIYENIEPTFLPIDRSRHYNPELPSLNLFSEANSLVEIGEETATYFDGLGKLENVWEGTGIESKQIAKRKRSSTRILSKRPKKTIEKEQVAKIPFKKSPDKTLANFEDISGKQKAPYQSTRKISKPPKPLFSLSQAESLSFLP